MDKTKLIEDDIAKIDKNLEVKTSLEEKDIVFRARNHKGSRHPKNTDILTYKYATGFEALIGYLYLEGKQDRINEIMEKIRGDK